LTVTRKSLFNFFNLLLVCSTINRDEFGANLNFFELGGELRGINKKAFLVKPFEKTFESFPLDRTYSFVFIQKIKESFSSKVMPLETILDRISQSLHNLHHMFVIKQMESEGILFYRYIHVTAVNTVPNRNISIDLGRYKLRKSTHTCHGFGICEPVDEMLGDVGFDGIEILNFSLIN
jgi:hypothetical protein